MAGNAIVLTGTVRTPLDAKRAADIACQFVAANGGSAKAAAPPAERNSTNVSVANQGARSSGAIRGRDPAAGLGLRQQTKLVINLLTVEGEEQVMLKVTVAEVQRAMLKQFGINLGAVINSGNFATALLTENALPLTAAAGLGTLPIPGLGTAGFDRDSASAAPVRPAATGTRASGRRLRQLGRDQRLPGRQLRSHQRPARAGARRPHPHAGRAEPDRRVGRDGQVPGRRRVSRSRSSTATASSRSPSRSSASASPSRRSSCRRAASA